MVIHMREFGRSLVTRVSGRAAYDSVTPLEEGVTTFDFEGVGLVSNSFADEVFGRLVYDLGIDELRRRTHFENVPPFSAMVIRHAIDWRSAEHATAV